MCSDCDLKIGVVMFALKIIADINIFAYVDGSDKIFQL